MMTSLQFQISQLRQDKLIVATESVLVFIACLFSAVFLPQLLFTLYYSKMTLTEEPVLLQQIPVIAFAVGMLFFVIAIVHNVMAWMKLRRLEAQLALETRMCCLDGTCDNCECCNPSEGELKEMEMMAEKIISTSKTKSKRSRSK